MTMNFVKNAPVKDIDAIAAALRGTNMCIITDSDSDEAPIITERVPYDITFVELKPYLRSLETLDKKACLLASHIELCKAETPSGAAAEDPEKLLDDFEKACTAYEQRKEELSGFIKQLEYEMERRILTERYLHYHDWNLIAKMLGMRKAHVKLIHRAALGELYEIMNYAADEAYANL